MVKNVKVKRDKTGKRGQNSPKNGKLSKRVETISKTHIKSEKTKKKIEKYFWSKWWRSKGPKWPKKWKIIQKGRKNVKKSEKIWKYEKKIKKIFLVKMARVKLPSIQLYNCMLKVCGDLIFYLRSILFFDNGLGFVQ